MRDEITNVSEEMARQGFTSHEDGIYSFEVVADYESGRFFVSDDHSNAWEHYRSIVWKHVEEDSHLTALKNEGTYVDSYIFDMAAMDLHVQHVKVEIATNEANGISITCQPSDFDPGFSNDFLRELYFAEFDEEADESVKACIMLCVQRAEEYGKEYGMDVIPEGKEHIFEEALAEAEKRTEIVEQQNKLQKWQKASKSVDAQTQNASATSTANASNAEEMQYLPEF